MFVDDFEAKKMSEEERALYVSGYAQALLDFGTWKDGSREIGCLNKKVSQIIGDKVKEFRLEHREIE